MWGGNVTRRRFLQGLAAAAAGTVLTACAQRVVQEAVAPEVPTESVVVPTPTIEPTPTLVPSPTATAVTVAPDPDGPPVVSITRIENKNIAGAVGEAIDLLGGIDSVTAGKNRILLKPNLRDDTGLFTPTSPKVVEALARLMQAAGKQVLIGEGSMLGGGFNYQEDHAQLFRLATGLVRTKNPVVLDGLQQRVFDHWGYPKLAASMGIPLVNLHTGDMVEVGVPDGFVFDHISLNSTLAGVDLVCLVPTMKTHPLAGVSLGMKNMMGAYPGSVYGVPLCSVHDLASELEPQGTAPAIVDIVRATKPGLSVVAGVEGRQSGREGYEGSFAMWPEGVVAVNLIIAGTNPLATDMVTAAVMGFAPEEVPTFEWAWKAGMEPRSLEDIEIRGADLSSVTRRFGRAQSVPYSDIRDLSWWCKEGDLPKKE